MSSKMQPSAPPPPPPNANRFKRKNGSFVDGDRYCTGCGLIIFGQMHNQKNVCPRYECKQPQQLPCKMWVFQAAVIGRCGGQFCGVLISETMKFCYACGHQNNHAIRKEKRDIEFQRQEERKKAAETVASLKAELLEARRQLGEKDEVIESQEKQLFQQLDMDKVLESDGDDDMDDSSTGKDDGTGAIEEELGAGAIEEELGASDNISSPSESAP